MDGADPDLAQQDAASDYCSLPSNMEINSDGYFAENCLLLVGWCRPGLGAASCGV